MADDLPPLRMLPYEVDRLLPLALADVRELVKSDWPEPPNPVKRQEFIDLQSCRFDRRVSRLNELLAAWKLLQLERLG
jgi:hypothetical protein